MNLTSAFNEIIAFERALKEYVLQVNPQYGKQVEDFFVGFEGSFGKKHVTPRTLNSSALNSTVCVEGIITKARVRIVSIVKKLKILLLVDHCSSYENAGNPKNVGNPFDPKLK